MDLEENLAMVDFAAHQAARFGAPIACREAMRSRDDCEKGGGWACNLYRIEAPERNSEPYAGFEDCFWCSMHYLPLYIVCSDSQSTTIDHAYM